MSGDFKGYDNSVWGAGVDLEINEIINLLPAIPTHYDYIIARVHDLEPDVAMLWLCSDIYDDRIMITESLFERITAMCSKLKLDNDTWSRLRQLIF